MHVCPEMIRKAEEGMDRSRTQLTIGCPELGLQGMQCEAQGEIGGQVEFPLVGTVLWEWKAGGKVLHPGNRGIIHSKSNLDP